MADIEAVVVSYKRPRNIAPILHALRQQSQPCFITLIDCAPAPEFEPQVDAQLYDRRLRLHDNHGGYNRFLGGFIYEREYTYFHDDDMLPGQRVLEHFLQSARGLEFGVLGQFGRCFPPDCQQYLCTDIPRGPELQPVDMIVRAYFVRTRHLHHVLRLKWALPPVQLKQDDMLLACALRMYGGLQSYLTPRSDDVQTSVIFRPLDDQFALARTHDHFARRTATLRAIAALGWPGPTVSAR